MIVPQYWAEASARVKADRRQITVRRWGWSDTSQDEAQAMADARAREALVRIQAGERLARREPKVAYNGADGVPIREEILSRHGDAIITRNAYGAQCLNTPNVLFADIDFPDASEAGLGFALGAAAVGLGVLTGYLTKSWIYGLGAFACAEIVAQILQRRRPRQSLEQIVAVERTARQRVDAFVQQHPDWHLRLYRTPAGLRVLVLHRTFAPAALEVAEFFAALGTDPVYVRMCKHQNCFRARVSPKPWRIGIQTHLKPRPGHWPVKPERRAARAQWVEAYERAAERFASCHFLCAMGSGRVDPDAYAVQVLHDQLCQAGTTLPLG